MPMIVLMNRSTLEVSPYQDYFNATRHPCAILDADDHIIHINPSMQRLLGKAANEILGSSLPLNAKLKRSDVRETEGTYYLHNSVRPVKVRLVITPIGNGACAVEVGGDNGPHTHDNIDADFIADQVPSGIIYSINSGVRISYANQAAAEIFNTAPNHMLADQWLDFLSHSERADVQEAIIAALEGTRSVCYVHPDNERTIELVISPYLRDGQLCGAWVGVLNDISEMKNREHDLEFAATHDALTGLRNALSFRSTIDERLSKGDVFTLAFCDINGFKAINDDWGHLFGDRVLTEVANRLRDRTTFSVFRYGGDEFILICECETEQVEEKVKKLFEDPLKARGIEISVGLSIGVVSTKDAQTVDAILDLADHKMYKQKRATKAGLTN